MASIQEDAWTMTGYEVPYLKDPEEEDKSYPHLIGRSKIREGGEKWK